MAIRFILGLLIVVVTAVYCLIREDPHQMFIVSGSIGLGLWAIAGLLSGTFGDTNNHRFNYEYDTSEDEQRRLRLNVTLWLLGLPSIITALILYVSVYR
ncbi:DUF5316 domain-containing protein [Paenibacillus apiarius]|uniref:DUF5316 domain-containing protein n=1 Tax=Paenibacillus apiarius TaxID=46240 RepID=UPI003B3B86D9